MKRSNLCRTAALRLSKPLREPTRAPSLAERNRIERSPHDGATVFETARGADPSTLHDEPAGSRWCRSPCPCEHHSGSGRGREPSRLTAHEWRTAVAMLHKPCRAPIAFRAMPARLSGQPSSNWYPCSDSNREPPRSKRDTSTVLGYRGKDWHARSDSNRYCRGPRPRASCLLGYARLVRAEGFQPSLDRV